MSPGRHTIRSIMARRLRQLRSAALREVIARPEIQNHLELLRNYLNREFWKQSRINEVAALWASVNWPGLLAPG